MKNPRCNEVVVFCVAIVLIGFCIGCSNEPRWDDGARMEKAAKQEFLGELQEQGYSEEQAWKEWQRQRTVKKTMGYHPGSDVRE